MRPAPNFICVGYDQFPISVIALLSLDGKI